MKGERIWNFYDGCGVGMGIQLISTWILNSFCAEASFSLLLILLDISGIILSRGGYWNKIFCVGLRLWIMSRLSVNVLPKLTSHLLNEQRMRIAGACHRVNEEFIATITETLSRRWSLTPSIETSWDLGSPHSMVTRNSFFSDQIFYSLWDKTKSLIDAKVSFWFTPLVVNISTRIWEFFPALWINAGIN